MNIDLFEKCIETVECVESGRIRKTQIDKIALVGGSTRISKLEELLTDFFDAPKGIP